MWQPEIEPIAYAAQSSDESEGDRDAEDADRAGLEEATGREDRGAGSADDEDHRADSLGEGDTGGLASLPTPPESAPPAGECTEAVRRRRGWSATPVIRPSGAGAEDVLGPAPGRRGHLTPLPV